MAVRITFKRSSIFNKRPNADLLDPGEIALNTNSLSPGLFFEADNNSVVKVGPTAVGLVPPTPLPSLGEMFFDEGDGTLKIGTIDPETAAQVWKDISTPYLGGTNGYVVFVAPEFPNASDAIANDGQAVPFKTLNRAVIEVAKSSIVQLNENDAGRNSRYTIVVAHGLTPVYNGPGLPLPVDTNAPDIPEFNVDFQSETPDPPTPLVLQQFNSVTGGLIVPRGTSIVGMDLRKVQLRPSYVPTYTNPVTGEGTTQPKSAILKWTGNSIVEQLSFRDKVENITISDFKTGQAGEGIFVSSRPHCLGFNDKVLLAWAPGTSQRTATGSASAVGNYYYAYPVGVNEFYLSYTNMVTNQANFIESSQLPASPQNIGFYGTCVWDIYSHNRLSSLYPATKTELDEFYEKVQLAFPVTFTGKANQAEVINPGETEIVAPIKTGAGESLLSNTTENTSPYCYNVSLRSNYGLCGLEQDGNLVTGFRSALATQFTVCSLQNDPAAYEIYTTVQDPVTLESLTAWYPLGYAAWATLPAAVRPSQPSLVPKAAQLELLNKTEIINIRYQYSDFINSEGFSYGIPDPETDFRHFAVRSSNGAYIQVDSGWTIGTAVGFWAVNGGRMTVSNSASNFTQIALRSEGFRGIGSLGLDQIDPADNNFVVAGIRMPQKLTPEDTQNYALYDIGPNILEVRNSSDTVQELEIGAGFQPINIQPFSLAPNTRVYVRIANGILSAAFINDGLPTVKALPDGRAVLRVRAIDSSFPVGSLATNPQMEDWSSPYIRRWNDPRNIGDSSYSLILNNTSEGHRDPSVGSVLRLNQGLTGSNSPLRPGVQFDPAATGGWGRLFQVAYSETSYRGNAPQLNEVMLNRNGSTSYYTALSLGDVGRPWLQDFDTSHGEYVTYSNRNWYAASNDEWKSVYFNDELIPITEKKLPPGQFNSAWAVSASSELLTPVEKAYQGKYAPDPRKELYKTGMYYRGNTLQTVNYGFDLFWNEDDGSPSFGLLDYKVPTAVQTTTTEIVAPLDTVIPVVSTDKFPNPFTTFSVVAIQNSAEAGVVEYCQLLKVDPVNETITVSRGYYGTERKKDWPAGSTVTVQGPQSFITPDKYDLDWNPSKEAMIRFLQVMGYSDTFISKLLGPRIESFRNQAIGTFTEKPTDGYALSTGFWPVCFAQPSQLNSLSHSLHSVGRLFYSKGLPPFLKNEITTKQYYDYISTEVWGGTLLLTGGDELGNLPTSGELTQTGTGRPYDTYSSEITDYTRTDTGGAGDSSGGGGGGGTVSAIYTGVGLSGGPIITQGTINLLPPQQGNIGGVKAGANVTIDPDGTINAEGGGGGGTITSITFTNGLSGGTVTASGTVGINAGTGLSIDANNNLNVKPGSTSEIGGVKAGTAITISTEGAVSVLPPAGPVIGGVKQGDGVTIAVDGTISVNNTPSAGIVLIDDFSTQFNGTRTQFALTVAGKPYTPTNSESVLITVGNIVQPTPAAYTIAGSTITFSSPPPAGLAFYGVGLNGTVQSLLTAGINILKLDDISAGFNGTATQFTLKVNGTPYTPTASYYAYISIGGIVQQTPEAYDVVGSTITFTSAPPADATFYGIAFG